MILGELEKRIFTLTSPEIIQSLFKAYNYKYEKRYAEAAEQFYNALKLG